jgi:PKD repeat protein
VLASSPSQSAPTVRRLKRTLLAGLAVLGLGCLAAPTAFAAPDFTFDPASPLACEQVTFTALDADGPMWDYENNGNFVSDLTHTFQTEGTHTVKMTSTHGPPATHDVIVENAPPVASFDFSPAQPDPGEWIGFHSTSSDCGDPVTLAWDLDGDGTTDDSTATDPVQKFDNAGPHDVTLTVDDGTVTDTTTETVYVGATPTAAFHRDPLNSVLLETGQSATFTSDSTASANNSIVSANWDIDGDGFDDGSGDVLTHTFTTPGTKVVRLEVEQTNGARDVAVSIFRVNGTPAPGFVWTPASPVAGGQVELFSTSVDAEGPLASEAWELDGDGDFDDAFGPSSTASFSAGEHEVSLRVTDGDGVSRTIARTITVVAQAVVPSPPAPTPPAPVKPAFMNPFPTVRLVGLVVPGGARITLVEVRGGPRGARVTVRCTGKGCPFRSRRRVAETGRVRLSNFTRTLAAGTRIEVLVRAPGVIGKYVNFRIRAGKRPVRTDRCLQPGASKPSPCT